MEQYVEDSPQFWEDIYLADEAGWDLGGPTPIFKSMAGELNPGKLCILGCGKGYDAVQFSRNGFDVTAVDFSRTAILSLEKLAGPANVHLNIIQDDIFSLSQKYKNTFDYVLEQTCFCAINPKRRNEYERLVYSLLKSQGRLIGLWFPLDKSPDKGGPPFGTTVSEVKHIFRGSWDVEIEEFPELSVDPRKGREKLIIFRKNNKGANYELPVAKM